MDSVFLVVAAVVAIALFFDFTNGFHDTANAMATPIATGALRPKTAVAIAAIMNLVGAFLGTAVAKTISTGMFNEGVNVLPQMVFAGLTGAVVWNLLTWFLGLPSSSSHALFGGLVGAGIAFSGFESINFANMIEKVVIPALFAPFIAAVAAFVATRLAYVITMRSDAERASTGIATGRGKYRYGQWFSSSLVALAHGTNDGQKTMGVITLGLIAGGVISAEAGVPLWVMVSAAVAIAAGTYAGGWRIIRTMGSGLAEIKPAQGFAAETSTGAAILSSSIFGFALSTTQVASGSVIGAGLGRRGGAVRWSKAGQIVLAWFFTLPASALVGAASAWLTHLGTVGLVVDGILMIAVSIAIFQISRRNKVNHHNVRSEVEGAAKTVASPRQVRIEAAAAAAAAKKAAKKSTKKGGKK
ncbi:MAG: inorganic phosphate transporter [Rhodoluna sp.]|nr:inorganic phosphate transporter [Rhodoluna sp.]MBP6187176.1 inorganic phosphate transporter [Rhodoluna sp.]